MPGLAGIISRERAADHSADLALMLKSMMHESFYVSGACIEPDAGVYAGWVAHSGSFAHRQSRFHKEHGIDIGFAGEFVETSSQRDDKDSGSSIVALYRTHGDAFVERLNGVFGGFIFDRSAQRVLIFNDRYGLERLYIHETPKGTYFASEAKALLAVLPTLRSFDHRGVADFLTFGCPQEGRTFFQDIKQLPGGSVWTFDGSVTRRRRYFHAHEWESQPSLSPSEFEAEFQKCFVRARSLQLTSESPLGISLTGGLDTRMIMACSPPVPNGSVCYTFDGPTGRTVDAKLAARVAESCGLEYKLLRIDPDFFSDFERHMDRTVYITDGCLGILGTHEIYLNTLARQVAPLRLTGNFGSEILRGISTFKPVGLSHGLLSPDVARLVNGSIKAVSNSKEHPVTFAAFREIPWNLFGSLAAAKSQVTFRTPYLDNELVALAYRTPEQLWKSSQPALQLIKAHSALLSGIPTDRGFSGNNSGLGFLVRRFLAEATFKIDYYNSEGLPRLLSPLDSMLRRVSSNLGILGMHKYLPYSHWFREKLAPVLLERVSSERIRQAPWWKKGTPEVYARAHVSRRGNYMRELNAILTLESIDRLLFHQPQQKCLPSGPIAPQVDSDSSHKAATLRQYALS